MNYAKSHRRKSKSSRSLQMFSMSLMRQEKYDEAIIVLKKQLKLIQLEEWNGKVG